MINNTAVENKHPTEANIDTVYPITFSGATDSGGLPMFKVTLTYADGSSKELEYNIDYKLVYDDVQENNNESFNKPHLNGIKFLLPEYAVDGNTLYILRTTPFVQPVDFQIGRIDPEQIEKIADLSVLRDQEIRNQADKDRDNISDLYDITAGLRTDIDAAQDSADAAMAHSIAVEVRTTKAEEDIAINRNDIAINRKDIYTAQGSADAAMAHSVAVEVRMTQAESDIVTNRSDIHTAQESADDAMAHSVAVEKRVSQNEKDIASNDKDIANLFNGQASHNERISKVEAGKLDKNQGDINAGKYLRVGADGYIELTAQGGGGGSGGVEHDESLVGSGSAEFPLKVSKNLSLEKVSISDGTRDVLSAMSTNMARELFPDYTFFGEGTTITSQWALNNPDINRLEFLTPITFHGWMPDVADDIAMKPISAWSLVSGYQVLENFVSFTTASSQTMAGALVLPELTVETPEGALNISVTAGVATIATNNGLDIASQTKFDTAPTTDDNTTWENALDTSLVRKAQVAAAIGSAASITIRNWQ